MATGGRSWGSLSSCSERDEEPSLKYAVTRSFFDRLVQKIGVKVRDLLYKLRQQGVITPQQRDDVIKTLEQQQLEDDYAPSFLFDIVLKNIQKNDTIFDWLLLVLRESGFADLTDEMYRAYASHFPGVQEMEHDDAHFSCGGGSFAVQPTDASSKTTERQMSSCDSGIIATDSFTLPVSTSASLLDEPHMFVPHSQSGLVVHQPRLDLATTERQQCTTPLQESHSDEQSLGPSEQEYDTDIPMMQPDQLGMSSLQSHPQLQEPANVDETEGQKEPIQVHNEQSNALLLMPNTSYTCTSIVEEVSGASSSEELVDHLSQRLVQMRLELQNKERELEARAQETQQSSELLLRCQGLEEQVRKMEAAVKVQKEQTDKVSSDKDKEINCWKRKCEEKEHEIQELRVKIAQQEQEKEALTKMCMVEIAKLQEQKKESAQKVADYEMKVELLDNALREATQKKEEAMKQLKIANCKRQEAVAERHKVENELLRSMIEKERELSRLKDANHRLELEISDLKHKNHSLVINKKDQEVLLHQKDKELVEHKLAEAEERHDNCARKLNDERRTSQHLQDENHTLKRRLSEFQMECSALDSPAKRSKTD